MSVFNDRFQTSETVDFSVIEGKVSPFTIKLVKAVYKLKKGLAMKMLKDSVKFVNFELYRECIALLMGVYSGDLLEFIEE